MKVEFIEPNGYVDYYDVGVFDIYNIDYKNKTSYSTANINCPNIPIMITDQELTKIYNDANDIGEGKNPPITTERIFKAMRKCLEINKDFNETLQEGWED